MSTRIYTTQHLVPAGTPIATPQVQAVVLDDVILDELDVYIPDGHCALTGIAVDWSQITVLPYLQGTWINGNNEHVLWNYGGQITANGLSVVTYNTDIFPHTFYLRWKVSDRAGGTPAVIVSPQASAAPNPSDVAGILGLIGAAV